MKNLDHLVYAVPNLEMAMDDIEQRFGIRPVYGGKHENQGTHNALIGLGNRQYFEIIAVDPNNKRISSPRWMGVDLIEKPMLTRWAAKTNDIENRANYLKSCIPLLGSIDRGSRRLSDNSLLEWTLTLPLPGPVVEILPFFIDWKSSEHPGVSLKASCKLISFEATHPSPERLLSILQKLDIDLVIKKSNEISLIATIQTPNGQQILS